MLQVSYKEEEHWNTGTHALGIVLGIIGAFLIIPQAGTGDGITQFSVWVYSLSIIVLFSASTLYHWVADPRIKRRLRILDHISIYFLIAGTYTDLQVLYLVAADAQSIGSRIDFCLYLISSGNVQRYLAAYFLDATNSFDLCEWL